MKIEAYLGKSISGDGYQKALSYFRASGVTEVTRYNRSNVDAIIAKYAKTAKSTLKKRISQTPVNQASRPVKSVSDFLQEPLKTIVPVPEQEGICPLCNGEMIVVMIQDDREVFYCPEHGIVTPMKVDPSVVTTETPIEAIEETDTVIGG